MKKLILIALLSILSSFAFGQNRSEAERLVSQGVSLHDKGDYKGAIAKYEKALELDKDNLLALAEMAFSLLSMDKPEEAITFCKKAIAAHPGHEDLQTVYVTCGNAYDALQKGEKSLEIYDEGIKLFPNFYQLHFNKGITLTGMKKYDEALLCFQKSVKLKPDHPGSHNAIARISHIHNNRIPALLAYCRFLTVEPQSNRAKENVDRMQSIMKGNNQKTGKNSITINISEDMLGDTAKNGKPKENNFSTTDLILALDAAMDYDKKNKKKSDVEQFLRKFETVCSSLAETQKDNHGFFWEYYVPYFVAMKEKDMLKTFAYIAFASSDDPKVAKWLKSHKKDTDAFFEWSSSFEWNVK